MASMFDFKNIVLKELDLPDKLLMIFEAHRFEVSTLVHISKDELSQILDQQTEEHWNIEEIFRRLLLWRQQNGHEIIGFVEVDVEEKWSALTQQSECSQEEPTNEELANPETSIEIIVTAVNQADEPAAVSSILSTNPPESEIVSPETQTESLETLTAGSEQITLAAINIEPSPNSPSKKEVDGREEERVAEDTSANCDSNRKPAINFTPKILVDLLGSTIVGKQILERASQGPLSSESQRELAGIIADYHCDLGVTTTTDVLLGYAESIAFQFKHETLDTYYVARGGVKKNPGGKIYNRISNLKQKGSKRKAKEEAHLLTVKKSTLAPPAPEDPSVEEADRWLEQRYLTTRYVTPSNSVCPLTFVRARGTPFSEE